MRAVSYDNIAEEIKSRCNIVDVIGRTVALKKTGNNHKGLCPFHNEKTPSFVVSEDKQMFTCFGCGASGDVIEFVKRLNNWDFREAIEHLAAECGVTVEERSDTNSERRNALYEINRLAARHFYRALYKGANTGFQYMLQRGITPDTMKKFGLGFADANWDDLYKYFLEMGTDMSMLAELGLVARSKEKYYDKFRNRVMFPIISTRGKVIGFGGRALGDDKPKYLNSPESPIFQKKANLYGLHLARSAISKENAAIIVEGYMDVIALFQYGVENVVATLGTAMTAGQAAMIRRYTDNVILSYDSDEAGVAAALRGMDILSDAGCRVRVLVVPDGKDPDEFIRKHGQDAFRELIAGAVPLTDYKIGLVRKKHGMETTQGRLDYIREVTALLKSLKSPAEADAYIRKIAAEARISEGALHLEVFGSGARGQEAPAVRPAVAKKAAHGTGDLLERYLLRLMIAKASFIPDIGKFEDVFVHQGCRTIYDAICALYKDDDEIDIKKLADSLPEAENAVLADLLENIRIDGKEDIIFADCLGRIRAQRLNRRQEEILKILELADEEADTEKIRELTQELIDIQNRLRSIV